MEIADFIWKLISRMRYMCLMFVLVSHGIIAEYHLSAASAIVKFDQNNSLKTTNHVRNRRMYAMCPPGFQRIGAECYSIVELNNNWLEAHFYCKDKNAKLAEPQSISDRKLRSYLQSFDVNHDPIWIGIAFDWKSNVWRTSIKGKAIKYQSFNMDIGDQQSLQNKCAVYDPTRNYSWSARACSDKYRFICQHKMPKVSEKNRQKVYDRWNVTYPNKFANEVLLRVVERDNKISGNIRRSQPIDTEPRFGNKHQDPLTNEVHYKNPSNNTETQPAPGTLQVLNSTKPSVEKSSHNRKTHYDRKLQRQREREKLRLQQRLERLEKKRRRLEKQKRKGEKSNSGRKKSQHAENLTKYQKQENTGNDTQPKEQNKVGNPRKNQDELPLIEERISQNENQRLLNDQEDKLQQDRENRMRQSQIDSDNLQKRIEEEKRYRDELYRLQLEEEEKRRQAEQKKKLDEEEKKLKMLEMQKQLSFEKQELERIQMEQRRRQELQQKRMLEIAKRKEIQRKNDEEEERLRKELEQRNETYEREQQEKIRREEEEGKAKAELEQQQQKQKDMERLQRLEEKNRLEDERIKQENQKKQRIYAERIAKLSPEDRKKFMEYRKMRKMNKRKQQQERYSKRLIEKINRKNTKNDY